MSARPNAARIDRLNIGLIILSCLAAFVLPFELFLFSYAVLGPLHYFTEISWLHDKNYYAKDRRDILLLLLLSLVIVGMGWIQKTDGGQALWANHFNEQQTEYLASHLFFIALGSAMFFVFIRKPFLKWVGVLILCLLVVVSKHFWIVFGIFLPTLIHVFIFTSIFMLFGALKSKSKTGYMAVGLHLLCPFILIFCLPGVSPIDLTNYGKEAYSEGFSFMNFHLLLRGFDLSSHGEMGEAEWMNLIFHSPEGIAVMRCIAFAYTYHYLNWFSKTEIIRWHKVPKSRFALVIIGSVVSIGIYAWDYTLGVQWLLLLSVLHLVLEFPLNWISAVGVFTELRDRIQTWLGSRRVPGSIIADGAGSLLVEKDTALDARVDKAA